MACTIVAGASGGAAGAEVCPAPRELPVMGALVESGLHDLAIPAADSVGYFQTRAAIWNRGEYAGPGSLQVMYVAR